MKASDMIESKYLKQSDVDEEAVLTIRGIKKANVAAEDQPEEMKWLIGFAEIAKPLVLNSTNIQALMRICGEETDDWKGKKVIVYVDHNVSFGGKLTGGLRIKQYKPETKPAKLAELDDDIPFN